MGVFFEKVSFYRCIVLNNGQSRFDGFVDFKACIYAYLCSVEVFDGEKLIVNRHLFMYNMYLYEKLQFVFKFVFQTKIRVENQ